MAGKMISREEIEHLAKLSRMELSAAEAASLADDVGAILEYVGQVAVVLGEEKRQKPPLRNVMREDVPAHGKRQFTEDILKNAPSREGDYLSVKKIL